jgi:hypothetical protein
MGPRRAVRFLPLGFLLLAAPPALPCDSTGCLMLTRGTAGLLGRGTFQVDVSFRYSDMSSKREGTDPTDEVIRPKVFIEQGRLVDGYHEDESASESFLQVDLSYGLLAETTVFASLPAFGQRYYDVSHGGVLTSYNVRGLGDLVLGVRQALVKGAQRSLVASLGFKVPTGSNDVIDEYDGTILDPTMQPGTGSGDVITALQWSSTVGKGQVSASASYQINTTNDFDYRFGNELVAAVTGARAFGRFSPSLQLKLWNRPRYDFVGDSVPSTGGTILYANGGARFSSADGLGFYAFVIVPVLRDINDAQLAPRVSVVAGLSKSF